MKLGLTLLPTVGPREEPADRYYASVLEMCEAADALGLSHVRAVEHYFHEWGGYSPDPVVFLTAVAARTSRIRLVTGAVVPAFQHPVKLAAALSLLDNLSGGRLDAGFGRAFLPSEFEAFGVPMSESRARMEEGVAAVERLWRDEGFRWEGTFHRFGPLPRLLPPPCQRPAPPVFVAATVAPESFRWAGERGYHLMVIPVVAGHERLAGLLEVYRAAWEDAGHPRTPRMYVSYHCYVAEDATEARQRAEEHFEHYKVKQVDAYEAWRGLTSDQYPGYELMAESARGTRFADLLAAGTTIAGDVAEVTDALRHVEKLFPEAEASLHVRFGDVGHAEAMRTVTLLGNEVLPRLAPAREAVR
ncbi:LLM class flavin-dependent oxidoreductase [Streptomyces sp. CRN 30]|uniref:LLM class flavin-dependent oxidoreductase n=1 Tax=Streptomyces sp. CRN 30 TaxID=3075613 RepID=UPI002A8180F9|nr:LLM class flavin-dependent oxidoreductase [Streptomyces sp. CRN 30]